MTDSGEGLAGRLRAVRERIAAACARCGRTPEAIELMAVSKTHPPEAVAAALAAGLRRFGENRVQELAGKRPRVRADGAVWELIGPLQRNKARLALQCADRIQTVDRPALVETLDRLCGELGRAAYPVLLQVNVAEDPAKHGCLEQEAPALLEAVQRSAHLRAEGLMTIGAFSTDERVVRATFAGLRELRDRLARSSGLPLPVLSMGMTADLEWAVMEGSTLLRIGTAIFGERERGR